MARKINENEKEVVLDRLKFDSYVGNHSYKSIWREMTTVYGMDLSYNALGAMIRGQNSWRLTYAWVVSDILSVRIEDLFFMKNIDVDKKIQDTLEWQRKYQN